MAYHPQMALKSSLSNLNPVYYYAKNITYDAAGRVDVLSLGAPDLASNPVLKTDYDYFGWDTQGGRLQFLKTGTTSDPISLQKFEYDYDLAGNIDWIKNYKAGGTQTQTFHYDDLDRLNDATASGGSGGTYPFEQYTYHPDTGNLASKAGVSYTYNAQVTCAAGNRTIAHAVSAAGGKTYTYDCNGLSAARQGI